MTIKPSSNTEDSERVLIQDPAGRELAIIMLVGGPDIYTPRVRVMGRKQHYLKVNTDLRSVLLTEEIIP